MTPYEHILCPVDFSDLSQTALRWASSLARELEGELTVLHVIDTELLNIGNLVAVPNAAPELRMRAREEWAAWGDEIDVSGAEFVIEEGAPADVIVDATESRAVDLLVMGTQGLSGIQKLLLGSVTEKVLHRVRVPLLAFSPRSSAPGRAVKNVLLAVDFGPESASVMRHGVWFAEHFGAKLFAVHVVPVPYVVLNERSLERLTPSQLERLQESLTADRREELSELLPETKVAVEVVTTVGLAFPILHELVARHDVDLVVMGRGGHGQRALGWVGSTCHKMVRASSCPVLIAP